MHDSLLNSPSFRCTAELSVQRSLTLGLRSSEDVALTRRHGRTSRCLPLGDSGAVGSPHPIRQSTIPYAARLALWSWSDNRCGPGPRDSAKSSLDSATPSLDSAARSMSACRSEQSTREAAESEEILHEDLSPGRGDYSGECTVPLRSCTLSHSRAGPTRRCPDKEGLLWLNV